MEREINYKKNANVIKVCFISIWPMAINYIVFVHIHVNLVPMAQNLATTKSIFHQSQYTKSIDPGTQPE